MTPPPRTRYAQVKTADVTVGTTYDASGLTVTILGPVYQDDEGGSYTSERPGTHVVKGWWVARGPNGPLRVQTHALRTVLPPKPDHYKIVCISLYTEDIARLDVLVAELKRRGHTKANKSQVIRAALDQIDLNKIDLGRR